MKIITSKVAINLILNELEQQCRSMHSQEAVDYIHHQVLKKKIRFPLLEYFSEALYKKIPPAKLYPFLSKIIALDEIGSYLIAGKMLQLDSKENFTSALQKAEEYIIKGNKWYVCDIIGERVMGTLLLTQPHKTIPVLTKYTKHKDKWMVRCIGVADHYAVKKGLAKQHVESMFELLLSLANTTEFHTKKGIGWAAKTTAKFYPDIIRKHEEQIKNDPEIKQWFKTKIKIGLGRAGKYASKYSS